jgi:ferrous iron transport protein B
MSHTIQSEAHLTTFEAISMIVGNSIGTGIIAVPYLATKNSMLDVVWMVLIAYCVNVILHLIIAELSYNNGGVQLVKSFEGELFHGKMKQIFSWSVFIVYGLAIMIGVSGNINGGAQIFVNWFGMPFVAAQVLYYVIAGVVVFIGMKAVGIAQKYAVIVLMGIVAVMTVGTFMHPLNSLQRAQFHWNNLLALYSMVVFATSANQAVIQVVKGLDGNAKQIRRSIFIGFGLSSVFVLIVTGTVLLGTKGALEKELGCKVVKTSALKGTGIHEVVKEAVTAAKKESIVSGKIKFSKDTEAAVSEMEGQLPSSVLKEQKKWYAIKLLERDAKVLEQLKLTASVQNQVEKIAARLEEKLDDDTESIITNERYEAITHVVEKCVKKPKEKLSTSDKIDQIVTNRILGLPIFLGVMYVVYAIAVMTIGTYVTDWTNDVLVVAIQDAAASGLQAIGTAAFLEDLIVNGIIGGLGAVLGFLPQMAILFVLLSILEDCGYMVRVAFVMDRIFRKFGLSGKSFIPLLISSGCGIPGIMASKTIENDNDRRLTIMTSTFVPCGAKLPVIALMAGVIGSEATGFPAGALTFIMYVIGVAAVLVSAIILKKTKPFHGDAAPFVMELPAYHLPQAKTVLIHTWERLKGFIRKAGTILLLACIVMWFLGGYGFTDGSFGAVEDSADSILASIGSVIAVIFTPLGFGKWQPVAASLSGFSAKEAIVTTMGVLANVAGDTEDPAVVAHGVATWFPSAAAGFSFLLFNLLDSPCLAAIATMAKELNDRKWFWFAILFQNVFAYVVTFMVYQISGVATGALTFGASTVVAILLLAVVLYLLFRKDPYKGKAMSVKRSVSEA